MEMRAPLELVSLIAVSPFRRWLNQGDGHTVLVIPGFLAPDASTAAMRHALRRLGYDARGWGLGVNLGPRPEVVTALQARLLALAGDGGPVSVVGWSLGGIYARLLAREYPEVVRTVVTIASPFRMKPGDSSRASQLYDSLEGPGERWIWRKFRERSLTVPATSIFTRLDGVVDWRACVAGPDDATESIEIRGASHIGLGNNPAAIAVIADRLSRDPLRWTPYRVPRGLRRVIVVH